MAVNTREIEIRPAALQAVMINVYIHAHAMHVYI